jgi:orotate phosphoribosyltransferase-like protein
MARPVKVKYKSTAQILLEQAERAYQLRLDGANIAEIADELGVSVGTAHARVKYGIEQKLMPLADDVRKLELDRLDMMWTWLLPKMERGDVQAIRTGLMVMDQRTKYISGLKVAEQVDAVIASAEIDDELKKYLHSIMESNRERERILRGEGEYVVPVSEPQALDGA